MIRPFDGKTPESYASGSAVGGVVMAAVLSLIPAIAFGSFWKMAAIFISADLFVYVLMKLGWLKLRRDRK
jgi:amino acid transporter